MQLNHLHLHVASVEAARAYYAGYFGLRNHVWHDQILFMRDDGGMDLALAPGPKDEMPPWFHFGFRLDDASAVAALHARMAADGEVLLHPLNDDGDMVWFRCADPDGHAIEVYWEVQPS
jgi:catechol 2,3-dioxygenase-like lactoylglutathione lyase family enzyme